MRSSLLFLFLGLALVFGDRVNDRPIIGILTQPVPPSLKEHGSSYIAASYVKYIESGGGRVVPVFHNSTTEELTNLFWKINGVLFPGGGADLEDTPIYKAGSTLYQLALNAFDKGDYFPITGHCLGFELLAMITSRNLKILSRIDAEDVTLPLNFTPQAKTSRWLKDLPNDLWNILSTKPVTMNNHVWCVSPTDFQKNEYLPNFYNILSNNLDLQGKEFISTFEGKKYPIYGMQWHAEKPQFEWNPKSSINHSKESIQANQYFARFLVDEARKSLHHFSSDAEEYSSLIYNYSPIYSRLMTSSFEQVYVF